MNVISKMKTQSGNVLMGVLVGSILVLVVLLAIIYREITRTPERTVMQQQTEVQAVEILSPDGKKVDMGSGTKPSELPTINEPVGMAGTGLDNRALQSGTATKPKSKQEKPKMEVDEDTSPSVTRVTENNESEVKKAVESKRETEKFEAVEHEAVKPVKTESGVKEKAKPVKNKEFDEEADLF